MTKLGVCYYPEHWPEEMWAEDARRMVDLGLSWVRIGEFAWSRIEPDPERFDWAWLDRAVDTLAFAGLKIVMGTPTATPPRWMIDKHPDMLALDEYGRPRKFGSRRHYCFSHAPYRLEAVRIARLMAQRYGSHAAVQAWQTDNEYGCHDTTISYSDAARHGFRDWLSQKYQSPDALNRAWGNVFWSMEYRSFDEIDLPNLTVTEANPAHVMDFRRYTSEQVVAFNKAQVDAIRTHSNADILHNYMGRVTDFDHFDVSEALDAVSWDSYPLGFLEDRGIGGEAHRTHYAMQGDPDFQAFHHDLYRATGRGRWWVMEQQPGPVNWAPYNPAPAPGMVSLWTQEAAAHGAEVVSYFRWRQAPFAQEQMHSGLLRPDSVEAKGHQEVRDARDALDAIGDIEQKQADVAIIFDYPSQWAWEVQPQSRDFDYFTLVFELYRALRSLGLSIDFIPAKSNVAHGYKLIFAPGLFSMSDDLLSDLQTSGAFVVVGPRANSKTPHFSIPDALPPNLPMDLVVTSAETLRPGLERPLQSDGKIIRWMEELETSEDVILQSQEGAAVLIRKNKLLYLGSWLDESGLKIALKQICSEAGVMAEEMPEGLRTRHTEKQVFWFNYNLDDVEHKGKIYRGTSVTVMSRQ